MEPSLLPAFSAPKGVSSPLSLAASSALTPARAGAMAPNAARAAVARMMLFILCLRSRSEGAAQGQRNVVAVGQRIAGRIDGRAAGERGREFNEGHGLADELCVGHGELPHAQVVALHAQ